MATRVNEEAIARLKRNLDRYHAERVISARIKERQDDLAKFYSLDKAPSPSMECLQEYTNRLEAYKHLFEGSMKPLQVLSDMLERVVMDIKHEVDSLRRYDGPYPWHQYSVLVRIEYPDDTESVKHQAPTIFAYVGDTLLMSLTN